MKAKPHGKNTKAHFYYPNLVPMSAIRRYARAIAERFHPHKIILFGSYAYGTPTPDSDVDLLVVMPAKNQLDQAVRIDEKLDDDDVIPGFPVDLIVRTPETLQKYIRGGDWFLREVVSQGKTLYEKVDSAVDKKGRKGPKASD
jgi:predicted nucleotidyltransferase